MNFLDGAKHAFRICFLLTNHPRLMSGGVEVRPHLGVAQLVNNHHEDLSVSGVILQIFRDNRSETTIIIVTLCKKA